MKNTLIKIGLGLLAGLLIMYFIMKRPIVEETFEEDLKELELFKDSIGDLNAKLEENILELENKDTVLVEKTKYIKIKHDEIRKDINDVVLDSLVNSIITRAESRGY